MADHSFWAFAFSIRLYDRERTERFVSAIMQKHDLKFASDQSGNVKVKVLQELHGWMCFLMLIFFLSG
jgi:hypothetical protein